MKITNLEEKLLQLLRKTIGEQVTVIDYTVSPLLLTSKNYGSELIKINARIKIADDQLAEDLFLVAKTEPMIDEFNVFDISAAFRKEIYIFEHLVPFYKEMETHFNLTHDIFPKFFGGKLREDESKDRDSFILLENLQISGYTTIDERAGTSLSQAKLALTKLAHFHALGIFTKVKKSDFFEKLKQSINFYPYTFSSENYNQHLDFLIKKLPSEYNLTEFETEINEIHAKGYDLFEYLTVGEVSEPWSTIIHGDFRSSNIFFHEENDKIDNVKFIDFPNAKLCNPIHDLLYFLFSSIFNIFDENFDELIDTYYDEFIRVLKVSDCYEDRFARQYFDEYLKKIAHLIFFSSIISLKYILPGEIENDIGSSQSASNKKATFSEYTRKIILKYIEKGWVSNT